MVVSCTVKQSTTECMFLETPSGTLPYAEIDGKPLGCSGAISIYLGRKLGKLRMDK